MNSGFYYLLFFFSLGMVLAARRIDWQRPGPPIGLGIAVFVLGLSTGLQAFLMAGAEGGSRLTVLMLFTAVNLLGSGLITFLRGLALRRG